MSVDVEVRGSFEAHGVRLHEAAGNSKGVGIWSASLLLADYFVEHRPAVIRAGDVVLEIGAGCGLPGLTAARAIHPPPSHVYLTDIDEETLRNLELNAELNRNSISNTTIITVAALDFDSPEASSSVIPKVDVVLAADVLYSGMSCTPIITGADFTFDDPLLGPDEWRYYENNKNVAQTLNYFLKPSGKAFVIAQPTRGDDVPQFIKAAAELGLSVTVGTLSVASMERSASQAAHLRFGGDVEGQILLVVERSAAALDCSAEKISTE
jgi:tRNA1(Val) A37 N6-methylase TrmN6